MAATKLLAMEARQEAELPRGAGWQYEPKWDGFRCLAIRDGDKVEMLSRSGKTLARYFPDMVAALKALKPKRWLKRAGGGELDGVIAKRLDEAYRAGERAMVKVKCLRTADCVVGGFRYATNSKQVGSLLLGLFNGQGKLDHVGFTSGISEKQRPALTRKVEALKGGPGFTGDAPGGPSRWSTERSAQWEPLKLKLVAEVQYDHA